MDLKLKIDGWDKMTMSLTKKIQEIQEEALENGDVVAAEIRTLSLLMGVPEELVYNLKYTDIEYLKRQMAWLSTPPELKDIKKIKEIKIGDDIYTISPDLSDFTYSQFADYQTYLTKEDNDSLLLTTILVPKGKAYGVGYSVDELREKVENEMPIITANAVLAFFFRKLKKSYRRSLYYFASVLLMKGKWKELKKVVETARML